MLHARGVYLEAKPFSIGFRIEHPQSLIDRARFGPQRRPSDPRRGRLQAGASRQQRPLGLQLLHVPGRHRGRRDLRAGPRGHQRHEPVLAQRAQRQRRHRGRHRRRTIRDLCRGGPLAGIALPAALGSRAPSCSAAATTTRRASWSAISSRGRAVARSSATCSPRTSRACAWATCDRALPDYAIAAIREALPAFDKQIRGFAMHDAVLTGVETRTSSPVRITRDDRPAEPQHARPVSRPAKARAMPAASCRPASTASRSPRRWLETSSKTETCRVLSTSGDMAILSPIADIS